jgi:hypothetical protein
MRKVSDKTWRENKTYFIFGNFFENHAVYGIMWNNIVEPARIQVAIWRMRFACWINKATNKHAEYVL